MCYFMNVASDQEIKEAWVQKLWDECEIVVARLMYVKQSHPGTFYYSIHRQCACDLIDPYHHRSNVDELKEFFAHMHSSSSFQFIITDSDAVQDGIVDESIPVIMNESPKVHLLLDDFLDRYPLDLLYHTVYEVI